MKHYLISIVSLGLGCAGVAIAVHAYFSLGSVYSNDKLHRWACNQVYKHYPSKVDPRGVDFGCYDICDSLIKKEFPNGKIQSLPTHYSDDLVNACAIAVHGQEW